MTTHDLTAEVPRWRRAASTVAGWARRVYTGAPRPLRWMMTPQHLTVLAWMMALLIVGSARLAAADDIIVGPNLAGGGPKTLYEAFDLWAYQLTVKPDDEASGWLDVGKGLLEVVGFFNYLLLWLCLGLLYGGLTLLEWFLNLTVYDDSAAQIDGAVRMMADQVFWPLIPATVAVGLLIAYTKWRGEGRGFATDVGWILAATALACGFAAGPSTIMSQIDGVRQNVGSGVIAGAAGYINTAENPVGYDTPQIGGDPQTAGTRKLVDGLWNTFGATPWCYAEFRDLSICREAGVHALRNDETWKGWMEQLDNEQTPPEFKDKGDYIRGQDMTRTGVLLLMALVTVPLSWLLLRLVFAGLTAVVGFLLMLVVGLVFLTFWPIEGFLRRLGTQFWIYTLGLLLQAFFITVAVSGLMVVSTVLATLAGQYGFFLIAVLNVALMFAADKARSWLDMLTTVGGGSGGGLASVLIARSITRAITKTVAGAATGGAGAVAGFVAGANRNRDSLGGAWRNVQLRKGTGSGMSRVGLDNGPVQAMATRMRKPGNEPQLPGSPTALPAGTGTNGHSSSTATTSTATAGQRTRAGSMAAQGTGPAQAAAARTTTAPSDLSDGRLARNAAAAQQRTGGRGRVWVAPAGGAPAPLDSPNPRPARPARDSSVHSVTTATAPRRGYGQN